MDKKKVTIINEAAKTRLKAIEMYQSGVYTLEDLAQFFGVHKTTISAWINMYEEGGIERLKAPMKPRPVHILDAKLLSEQAKSGDRRLLALLDLANGKGLNETAAAYGVTPQGLAKWRRQYLNGELL